MPGLADGPADRRNRPSHGAAATGAERGRIEPRSRNPWSVGTPEGLPFWYTSGCVAMVRAAGRLHRRGSERETIHVVPGMAPGSPRPLAD
jgi:hypothetical protein